MRIRLLIILAISLLTGLSIQAQERRSVTASPSVIAYRPVGDFRLWTFISSDTTLGRLTSRIIESTVFNGDPAIQFESRLTLDYNVIGREQTMDFAGVRTVNLSGRFLAEQLQMKINDQDARISVERRDTVLTGRMTRGEQEVDVSFPYPKLMPAANGLFLDQYEMYFAMRNLTVGERINDTMYVPRDGIVTPIVGEVFSFSHQRRYNEIYDSVFSILLTQPEEAELLFTPDKKLVKAIFPARDMRVYLDIVRNERQQATTDQPARRQRPTTSFMDNLPHYAVYLVGTLIAIAFFIKSGYRWSITYIAAALGLAVFWIVPYTQVPLQNWIFNEYFVPGIRDGGSPLTWAVLPSVAAGIMQELIKLAAIFAVSYLANLKQYRIPIIGAVLGAAFGYMEAWYLISLSPVPVDIFSWTLMERLFLIVFHTASGALLGQAVSENMTQVTFTTILLIAVNSLWRYLPVMVQETLVPVQIMYLLLAVIGLVMLFTALMVRIRAEKVRAVR